MPKAILTTSSGAVHALEVAEGVSLMQAATQAGIDAICGDCGGSMTCGTCHIIVDDSFVDRLPPLSDTENAMLDFTAAEREPNSRLSCQIKMSAALDGISARIADPQV